MSLIESARPGADAAAGNAPAWTSRTVVVPPPNAPNASNPAPARMRVRPTTLVLIAPGMLRPGSACVKGLLRLARRGRDDPDRRVEVRVAVPHEVRLGGHP